MKNQEQKDITYKKIAWTITNFFSSLLKRSVRRYSEVFILSDCAWRLYIYRGRADGKSLAICLEAVHTSSFPEGSILANFGITVVNQVTRKKSRTRDGAAGKFHANCCSWGYAKFMPLSDLEDANSGYVLNGKCIVEVELFSVTFEGIEPTSRPTYPSLSKQPRGAHSEDDDVVDFKDMGKIEQALVPMLEDVCSRHPSLMDSNKKRSRKFTEWAFTGLGRVLHFLENKKWKDMNEEACEQLQALWEELEMSRLDLSWLEPHVKFALNMKGYLEKIEQALVPMLEDVCSRHPSLMDSNKKRSRKFTEWAFTGLGRVLHFLENKKWKDMNEEACEQLQALWEELEMSRLDLSWLEPHVKFALNMKGYLEKAMKVKRLKQDLVVLGMEMNKIKENLASTELMVEMTSKDLIKEQEGFEELDLDLDAEIGYGKPYSYLWFT